LYKLRGVKPAWVKIINANKKEYGKRRGPKPSQQPSVKVCDRCHNFYKTMSRRSKFCDKCKLPSGMDFIDINEVIDEEWEKKKSKPENLLL
jgi:hypothetical protein